MGSFFPELKNYHNKLYGISLSTAKNYYILLNLLEVKNYLKYSVIGNNFCSLRIACFKINYKLSYTLSAKGFKKLFRLVCNQI